MEHTKGEWTVAKNGYTIYTPQQGKGFYVAEVHPHDPKGPANAHLIAAAPDLLKACEELMQAWIDDGYRSLDQLKKDMDKAYLVAKAAIAKAKP